MPPSRGSRGDWNRLYSYPMEEAAMKRVERGCFAMGRDSGVGTSFGTLIGVDGTFRKDLCDRIQQDSGIYGELTAKAQAEIIQFLIDKCNLNSKSSFIDVGSGRGKVCCAVACLLKLQHCFGVELQSTNHVIAVQAMEKARTFFIDPEQFVGLLNKDAGKMTSMRPFTHVFSYSFGMPEELLHHIVTMCEQSDTVEYLVLFFENPNFLQWLIHRHELVVQFHGRKESGSGRTYPCFIVRIRHGAEIPSPKASSHVVPIKPAPIVGAPVPVVVLPSTATSTAGGGEKPAVAEPREEPPAEVSVEPKKETEMDDSALMGPPSSIFPVRSFTDVPIDGTLEDPDVRRITHFGESDQGDPFGLVEIAATTRTYHLSVIPVQRRLAADLCRKRIKNLNNSPVPQPSLAGFPSFMDKGTKWKKKGKSPAITVSPGAVLQHEVVEIEAVITPIEDRPEFPMKAFFRLDPVSSSPVQWAIGEAPVGVVMPAEFADPAYAKYLASVSIPGSTGEYDLAKSAVAAAKRGECGASLYGIDENSVSLCSRPVKRRRLNEIIEEENNSLHQEIPSPVTLPATHYSPDSSERIWALQRKVDRLTRENGAAVLKMAEMQHRICELESLLGEEHGALEPATAADEEVAANLIALAKGV